MFILLDPGERTNVHDLTDITIPFDQFERKKIQKYVSTNKKKEKIRQTH